MSAQEIQVPDIGDFADVPIIEIHVRPGDTVAAEDPLLTLESDKATLDVPAPFAGTITELRVGVGDTVSRGTVIAAVDAAGPPGTPPKERIREDAAPATTGPADYGSPSGVYERIDVDVPDIGGFADVPVIEVHVAAGDRVAAEDPLITLESDKATMDVPSPATGTIEEVTVAVGDTVSQGHVIAHLRTRDIAPGAAAPPPAAAAAAVAPAPRPPAVERGDVHAEVLVLGAGPGGYTAAFRAADLGKSVVLVDRWPTLGGVCLNVGCIPSKALLHAAKVIAETREMAEHGLSFTGPAIDVDRLRGWKDGVVSRLTGGLAGLARQRKVTTVQGAGRFMSMNQLEATADDGSTKVVSFDQAIIAAGSEPITLPFVPHDDPRVIDSTGALALDGIPERLLVLGGGIIGLEMATVYSEIGSAVTVVELMDQLIPGADKDIVAPLTKRITERYENIYLKTKVTAVEARPDGLLVTFDGSAGSSSAGSSKAPQTDVFDRLLVSVGRRPNGREIGAENAGVLVDDRGFIRVDKQQRTNVPHIFAIGDVVGQPMLAHKAVHEGKVAAEVTAGRNSYFDAKAIPSVAYTDPEVAWAGITENEAKAAGVKYGKGVFPWAASGRSLSLGRDEGMTKILFDETTERIIGCGIVGPSAGDLISEAALAIEMGADAADIGLTVHPHPTLSETIGMAAEAFEGTLTDLYMPKKKT
ncbi:dihydrolipoyl dehydrogenase [Pseudonocardia bannensis]|uniref:Dihydrolipoyl dehydrogenase n=1 Tax=Pseudonocardia bannensis TaxID=630973 RepID=A0A848DD76_9PSEU|nr:dihydrolipoyl dehydrogenase [Pseudonocardia bannensis]